MRLPLAPALNVTVKFAGGFAAKFAVTEMSAVTFVSVLGFAVDLVTMNAQDQPDWGDQPRVALAPTYGLRSGAEWGDKPHLELAEGPAKPTAEAQQTYLQAGVQAVWTDAAASIVSFTDRTIADS